MDSQEDVKTDNFSAPLLVADTAVAVADVVLLQEERQKPLEEQEALKKHMKLLKSRRGS